MAMRAFNFTLPATTNYYNLWTTVSALPGWSANNIYTPDRGCELVINSDSGTIYVSDSNNANVAGTPVKVDGSLLFRTNGNGICLKEIWIKGSGLLVSGWYIWS